MSTSNCTMLNASATLLKKFMGKDRIRYVDDPIFTAIKSFANLTDSENVKVVILLTSGCFCFKIGPEHLANAGWMAAPLVMSAAGG